MFLLINNLFSYVLCTKYTMNGIVDLTRDSMTVFQKYVVVSGTTEVVNRQSVHIYTSLVDESQCKVKYMCPFTGCGEVM